MTEAGPYDLNVPDYGHTASQVPGVPTCGEIWTLAVEHTTGLRDDLTALLAVMEGGFNLADATSKAGFIAMNTESLHRALREVYVEAHKRFPGVQPPPATSVQGRTEPVVSPTGPKRRMGWKKPRSR